VLNHESNESILINKYFGRRFFINIHNKTPEGKRPLGRPRRRWVDNIKMDLREIGWDGMDWIDLAQDKDQYLRVP
jgi:hypothetical protein